MRRWLVAAVLICAFIALAAYYNANITYHLDVPRESEVSANYEAYIGRTVTISGIVVSTGAQSFELKGESSTYTIFSSEAVQLQDRVTVIGTPGPDTSCRQWRCSRHRGCSPRRLRPLVYCAHLCGRALFRKLAF
jgi:hypothetical protein